MRATNANVADMLAALAGGVGAARFLSGLLDVVPATEVTAIVNTGDDDKFHGLWVCPDLDSVTYHLSGNHNHETGWGLADETFRVMEGLDRFGSPTWFRLGDRDLATHLYRTERLNAGATLSEVTSEIAKAWGLEINLIPMTNDRVATRITIADNHEEQSLQEWFVKNQSTPVVESVRFENAEMAQAAPGVIEALSQAETIIICPSNPIISISPILAVPKIREVLIDRRDHVVGVSPIIAGRTVRGPADRLMDALGIEVSCVGVAATYQDFCGTLVIDSRDADLAGRVNSLGVRAVIADTMMSNSRVAAALARETVAART
jgi:LPPG:FO 2-phospho-L-lactate transferase